MGIKRRIAFILTIHQIKQLPRRKRLGTLQHYFHLLLQWIDNEANHYLRHATFAFFAKSNPEHPLTFKELL